VTEFDYVISAIGQTQDLSFIGADCDVSVNRDCLVADHDTGVTNIPGIFATGDAVTGPLTAIKAIAGGKRAALAMDQYLRGETITKTPALYNHVRATELDAFDLATLGEVEPIERVPMPVLTEAERHLSFAEVERGYTEAEAKREAARCLKCGCADVDECKLRAYATVYHADQFALSGAMEKHPIDESHPYIVRDRNKCVSCGRCVRICVETGAGVLGFVGRGFDTTIEPSFSVPFGEEKNCTNCGLCVSTCPVGALVPKEDVALPTDAYLDIEDVQITSITAAVEQAKAK